MRRRRHAGRYDPSVEGRFKLYVASMQDLLQSAASDSRRSRVSISTCLWWPACGLVDNGKEKQLAALTIVVPKGTSVRRACANFQHKQFVDDLVDLRRSEVRQQKLAAPASEQLGDAGGSVRRT